MNGTPLQYSCLENLMDGGAWQAAVHGAEMQVEVGATLVWYLLDEVFRQE